jgi:uncharacterized membrane protein
MQLTVEISEGGTTSVAPDINNRGDIVGWAYTTGNVSVEATLLDPG